MPLPDSNVEWPPRESKDAAKKYDEWYAWYSGDPDKLADQYRRASGLVGPESIATASRGEALKNPRFFWGSPIPPDELRHTKMHIPLASDISSTSADLLFGEPPEIKVLDGDKMINERIEKMVEGGLTPALWESAELGSALGGSYVRVTWDEEMADHPLFDAIPPDAAVPEWRSGKLEAVTFWRSLATGDKEHFRHLERHEKGRVYHALYKGTGDKLGPRVRLEDHPETAVFTNLVNEGGWVETGARGLTAEYVPNMRPNRVLRGSALGRSDYSGIEQTMDALDETWSSLMRDIRLGKGRMVVPDSYLQSSGPGSGARFNMEQAIFTPVTALPDNDGVDLKIVQFDIRIEKHLAGVRALAAQAVRGAGYSAQTFGDLESTGQAATATEIQSRNARSFSTRARKIGYTKPPLRRLMMVALEVDAAKFRSGVTPELPDVIFPDGVQTDEMTVARTVQMLDSAAAVSARTKIEMVHPQWDKDRVNEEVEAIQSQQPDKPPAPGEFDMGDAPDLEKPGEETA